MKNLKTVAVVVLLLLSIFSFIYSYRYYETLVSNLFTTSNIVLSVNSLLQFVRELLTPVLAAVFLLTTNPVKDKVYRLLRFVVVIYFFLYLPFFFYYLFTYFGQAGIGTQILIICLRICYLFCVIVLIIAKPDNPVENIDLTDYELVGYTTTGHRLVHYLLDLLFVLPLWLSWISIFSTGIFITTGIYLLYCFLAEAVFRQTFGKICTNSCVVSNGYRLSAGQVLLRTLCRFIPFDALSFLFKANWHDRISSTAVVYVGTWQRVFDEPANSETGG